jgi:hypothetical protein
MEFTTHLELQSQTTRLKHAHSLQQPNGSITLYAALFQGTLTVANDANTPQFFGLSTSRFSRPY